MTFSNLPDNIIDKALSLFDEGVPVVDIVAQFPEQKKELEDLFGSISLLRHEGRQLPMPSRESLKAALNSLPLVTESSTQRYPIQEEAVASSYIIGIFNSFESFMSAYWKVLGSFGTVAVVALVFFASDLRQSNVVGTGSQQDGTLSQESSGIEQKSFSADMNSEQKAALSSTLVAGPADATGSVDDAINAFLADADGERAIYDQDESIILASTDSNILNEFDTTISSYEY